MSLSSRQRLGIGLLLAAVMAVTRLNHFGAIPDASWAVFLLGGFYLRQDSKWAFPVAMVLAVAVDWFVIRGTGLSFWNHYCVSIAYWCLVPAYGAMWLGGALFAKAYRGLQWRALPLLLATLVLAEGACFLLSNGSFYWLSDTVTAATFAGWTKNLGDWYLPYLYTTSLYVAIGAVVHVVVALAAPRPAAAPAPATR
jgi:hypothetical protein